MGRAPLTVVVPTLDEEGNLPACLASVGWTDEVIVVDSGSRDRTLELARAAGARAVVRPFTGYGDQRNHGAALAGHDWVLCLDADERVTPELRREIEELLAAGPALAGYLIPRRSRFAGRIIRHCGWQRDRVLRLYDRRRGRWDARRVHERVVVDGAVGSLRAVLLHETYRDLGQFAGKTRRYALEGAEELHRAGRRGHPPALLLLPASRFLKMYLLERGFLDGVPGLVLCLLASYGVFLKQARLWELGQDRPGGERWASALPAGKERVMALSPELLEILACPVCKVGVHLTADGNGLKCEKCYRVYPIREDIPVMLVEEAKVEAPGGKNEAS